MVIKKTYRIIVRPITGTAGFINFKGVKKFEVVDGFLVFEDEKTGHIKRFAVPNCEIEEEDNENA